MAPKDVAGVFSRYFIVGFFLPAFFAAVILGVVLSGESFPDRYQHAALGTQTLILGGVALLFALLLSGLHYHVLRLFEGYPIQKLKRWRCLRWIEQWRRGHWQNEFKALEAKRAEPTGSPARTPAALRLATCFPPTYDGVMPTRFGNVVRSFERHPRPRYGFDGVTIWDRMEMLLSANEHEIVNDARADVALFVNTALLATVVGLLVIADAIWHGFARAELLWVYLAPFAVTWIAYRWAAGAATRWGRCVRASFDLHRFELYERLGIRRPETISEEEAVGKAATRCLLYGEPIPDDLRAVN